MGMIKKLAVLAAAAGAALRYAKKNPEQASKFVDQAAGFVDKQTKGKYSGQISGAAEKAKSAAGIDPGPRDLLLRVRPPLPLPVHHPLIRRGLRSCQDARRAVCGRPDRAPHTAGNRARGHEPGAPVEHRRSTVSVPRPWIPESVPTPEQVVAGLKATDEGGRPAADARGRAGAGRAVRPYAADIGVAELQGLYRDMVLVRRFDREANALQRQGQLGIWVPLLGPGGRADRGRARARARRTWRSPLTASTVWRGAAVSTRPSCWGSSGAPTRAAGTRAPRASTSTRSSSATSASTPPATRWGRSSSPRWATGPTPRPPSASSATAPPARATSTRVSSGPRSTTRPSSSTARTTSGPSPSPPSGRPACRSTSAPQGYGFPGIRVDGNDVLACLAVTRWALEECRSGNGPVLVEAFTYRMDAHTTSDDPTRYRLADELELWKLKDPIERVRVHLVRALEVGQEFFDEVAAEADALAERFRAVLHGDARSRPGADLLGGLRGGVAAGGGATRRLSGVPRVVRDRRVACGPEHGRGVRWPP